MITAANTHEMSTKHNVPEMDEQNGKRMLGATRGLVDVHELDSESKLVASKLEPAVASPQRLGVAAFRQTHQRIAIAGGEQLRTPLPDNAGRDDREAVENEASSGIREPREQPHALESHESMMPTVLVVEQKEHKTKTTEDFIAPTLPAIGAEASSSTTPEPSQKEEKLKLFRERMEGTRVERERLERLQELKDLEEATRREIAKAEKDPGAT